MPKKKLPQTIEECNAELERTQKELQQYVDTALKADAPQKTKTKHHDIDR